MLATYDSPVLTFLKKFTSNCTYDLVGLVKSFVYLYVDSKTRYEYVDKLRRNVKMPVKEPEDPRLLELKNVRTRFLVVLFFDTFFFPGLVTRAEPIHVVARAVQMRRKY